MVDIDSESESIGWSKNPGGCSEFDESEIFSDLLFHLRKVLSTEFNALLYSTLPFVHHPSDDLARNFQEDLSSRGNHVEFTSASFSF
jgi:hypothetical protein